MKASSIFLNLCIALFLIVVNHADESEAIFLPIIKPDLRFLAEKKKQLLSFVNVPAVLQILGQVINLNAVMQHFGLAPPAAPGAAAGLQRGSGSANKATVVPPPTATELLEPDCDDSTTVIPVEEGSQESQNIPTVQDSSQEAITEASSSSNEGSQELDESAHERSVVIQHDGELSGEQENEEIPTKGSEELKTTDGNGIEVEFRRRKMESLRRRYLLNALERLRKI